MRRFYCLYSKKNVPYHWILQEVKSNPIGYFKSRLDCIDYFIDNYATKNKAIIWFHNDLKIFEGSLKNIDDKDGQKLYEIVIDKFQMKKHKSEIVEKETNEVYNEFFIDPKTKKRIEYKKRKKWIGTKEYILEINNSDPEKEYFQPQKTSYDSGLVDIPLFYYNNKNSQTQNQKTTQVNKSSQEKTNKELNMKSSSITKEINQSAESKTTSQNQDLSLNEQNNLNQSSVTSQNTFEATSSSFNQMPNFDTSQTSAQTISPAPNQNLSQTNEVTPSPVVDFSQTSIFGHGNDFNQFNSFTINQKRNSSSSEKTNPDTSEFKNQYNLENELEFKNKDFMDKKDQHVESFFKSFESQLQEKAKDLENENKSNFTKLEKELQEIQEKNRKLEEENRLKNLEIEKDYINFQNELDQLEASAELENQKEKQELLKTQLHLYQKQLEEIERAQDEFLKNQELEKLRLIEEQESQIFEQEEIYNQLEENLKIEYENALLNYYQNLYEQSLQNQSQAMYQEFQAFTQDQINAFNQEMNLRFNEWQAALLEQQHELYRREMQLQQYIYNQQLVIEEQRTLFEQQKNQILLERNLFFQQQYQQKQFYPTNPNPNIQIDNYLSEEKQPSNIIYNQSNNDNSMFSIYNEPDIIYYEDPNDQANTEEEIMSKANQNYNPNNINNNGYGQNPSFPNQQPNQQMNNQYVEAQYATGEIHNPYVTNQHPNPSAPMPNFAQSQNFVNPFVQPQPQAPRLVNQPMPNPFTRTEQFNYNPYAQAPSMQSPTQNMANPFVAPTQNMANPFARATQSLANPYSQVSPRPSFQGLNTIYEAPLTSVSQNSPLLDTITIDSTLEVIKHKESQLKEMKKQEIYQEKKDLEKSKKMKS